MSSCQLMKSVMMLHPRLCCPCCCSLPLLVCFSLPPRGQVSVAGSCCSTHLKLIWSLLLLKYTGSPLTLRQIQCRRCDPAIPIRGQSECRAGLKMSVHLSSDLHTPCLGSCIVLLICLALILSSETNALPVIGGNKSVVEKGTVVLPCKLINNKEILSQISWRRKTRGKPQIDNFLTILDTNEARYLNGNDQRFTFIGDINEGNGSLQLSDVTLDDEGTYICVVTLFPSGNHQAEITLNLLVPPVSSLKGNRPLLGDEEVPLVTCTAAASKPPAEVKWLTGTLAGLEATTTNVTHDNGTTTTVSSLLGVPTMQIYQQEVKCVITSAAPSGNKTLTYSIQIYFPPTEVEIAKGKDSDTFECSTKANPEANFIWSRNDKPLPPSDVINGATLRLPSKAVEGLYHCSASNTFGSTRSSLFVTPGKSDIAGWVLFGLLLVLNVAAAAVWYLKFRRPQEHEHVGIPQNDNHPNVAESNEGDAEL